MVRGELVDESGGSPLEWIGLIRAARNPQEQTLEAVADLPGGQVLSVPLILVNSNSIPKAVGHFCKQRTWKGKSSPFKRANDPVRNIFLVCHLKDEG